MEEPQRRAVRGVNHVVAAGDSPGTVVLVPRAAIGHLVLVGAGGHGEDPGPQPGGLVQGQRGLGAVGLPVAGAPHRRVVAAGDGDQVSARLLPAGGRRESEVLAHPHQCGVTRRGGGALQHCPHLERGADRLRGDVGVDAWGVVLGDADGGPIGAGREGAHRERRLGPAVLVDRRGKRERVPGDGRAIGHVQLHAPRAGRNCPVRLQHDAGERGHGDGDHPVRIRSDPATAEEGCVDGRWGEGGDVDTLVAGRVVERHQVLDLLVAVDAGERVDAWPGGGEALVLGAIGKGGMRSAQSSEFRDALIEHGVGVVAVRRAERLPAQQRLGGVGVHLRGEHVLAGGLVAAGADEALLVAVVDDRLATDQVHQLVCQDGALLPLVGVLHEVADAAHVVVAEERRKGGGRGVGGQVQVVALEQAGQAGGGEPLGEVGGGGLEGEVQRGVHVGASHVGRELGGIGVVDLAEHEEVRVHFCGVLLDGGGPLLPELEVHMLDGVDAEAVDAHVHPGGVDVHHAVHHPGVFRHEVVQTDEVAQGDGLTRPRRVAPVVVEGHVVEPVGCLGDLVATLRGVGEGDGRVEFGPVRGACQLGDVDDVAGRVLVGGGGHGDVALRAFRVLDAVGGVVGDDVEVDLHAPLMGRFRQRGQRVVAPEVRVDGGEVGDPVAVVAGRHAVGGLLHRAVGERRREPDGGGAEALDVVELVHEARDVAAVVEPRVGGVEAVVKAVPGDAAGVIGGVTVGEAVGHGEVEVLHVALAHGGLLDGPVLGHVHAAGQRLRPGDPDALCGGVVGEGQRHVDGQVQDGVAAGIVVGAERRVEGAIEGDLELLSSGRHRVLPGEDAAVRRRLREFRRLAVGLPVAGAPQFGLERARHHHLSLCRRCGCGGAW